MGTSGNRDCQRASRSALKDFTDDALTISAGSLKKKLLLLEDRALLAAMKLCMQAEGLAKL